MKKLLLGLGSFVAAAAPVAAVVACGSSKSNTVHAGVDNGGNTGGTDGTQSGGSGATTIVTQAQLDTELAKITSIDLTGKLAPKLADAKPGDIADLVKKEITEAINANPILLKNNTTMNVDVKFKMDGTTPKINWTAKGDRNPGRSITTSIVGLDMTGLSAAAQSNLITLQSSQQTNLYNHANSVIATAVIIEVIDATGSTDMYANDDKWAYFTSIPNEVTLASGQTPLDFALATFVPSLTETTKASIKVTFMNAGTPSEETISFSPITW